MNFRPYSDFCCHTRVSSETRAIVSLCLDLKGSRAATESARNADDHGSGPGESPFQPGEIEGFPSAAGRVGARIKVENDGAPSEIGKRNGAPAVPP